MTLHPLDVVVLTHDIPAHGLRAGDLGAVVEVYSPDAVGVEFVAASGRTQALVTLHPADRLAFDRAMVTQPVWNRFNTAAEALSLPENVLLHAGPAFAALRAASPFRAAA